jgi:hypothetical protein
MTWILEFGVGGTSLQVSRARVRLLWSIVQPLQHVRDQPRCWSDFQMFLSGVFRDQTVVAVRWLSRCRVLFQGMPEEALANSQDFLQTGCLRDEAIVPEQARR